MLSLLWRFSRPHTLIGSTISILSLLILVIYCTPPPIQHSLPNAIEYSEIAVNTTKTEFNTISESAYVLVPGLDAQKPKLPANKSAIIGFMPVLTNKINTFAALFFPTLLACLLCNIFITGLNQIVDVDLDKINKPNLPLASGELSMRNGKIIVYTSGILAVFAAWLIQPFLGCLITSIAIIGALYSLPPIQFKRYHIWAASAIAIVRGPLINAGIAIHFATVLYGWPIIQMYWLAPLVVFVTAFSLGIAWFKDIPDTLGDEKFGFKTLAVVWSKSSAFKSGVVLVSTAYLLMAWQMPNMAAKIAHVIVLLLFVGHALKVDLQNPTSVKRFYMFYWGLFFLEYAMLPLLLM
jgi:homogentisate phytyltransferase/homogentisate geranylgeranyltransferase